MAGHINTHDLSRDETYIVSESSSVFGGTGGVGDDGEGDAPAVFMCGKCRRPVGDSLSWAGSDDRRNEILLKRVNENIVIGKEHFVSSKRQELGCLVRDLSCGGCGLTLGLVYTSTPKALDYKRSLFCFSVEHLESYVLGSGGQQVAALSREDRPVTFEYQEDVEQQITKIKSLAVTIGQRLLEIEVDLQCKSEN
ncbi:protein Mis18-alpha [Brachyhypopomus gauderio]|uniref:protein Mis18-alpha n=1 Tax=Brachyhypopomus gauderio TaxID=698409 RepID=UPI0040438975